MVLRYFTFIPRTTSAEEDYFGLDNFTITDDRLIEDIN